VKHSDQRGMHVYPQVHFKTIFSIFEKFSRSSYDVNAVHCRSMDDVMFSHNWVYTDE